MAAIDSPALVRTTIGKKLGLVHELGLKNLYYQIAIPSDGAIGIEENSRLVVVGSIVAIFGGTRFHGIVFVPTASTSSALPPLVAAQAATSSPKDASPTAAIVLLVLGSSVLRFALSKRLGSSQGNLAILLLQSRLPIAVGAVGTKDGAKPILDARTQTAASRSLFRSAHSFGWRSQDSDWRIENLIVL